MGKFINSRDFFIFGYRSGLCQFVLCRSGTRAEETRKRVGTPFWAKNRYLGSARRPSPPVRLFSRARSTRRRNGLDGIVNRGQNKIGRMEISFSGYRQQAFFLLLKEESMASSPFVIYVTVSLFLSSQFEADVGNCCLRYGTVKKRFLSDGKKRVSQVVLSEQSIDIRYGEECELL